MSRHCSASSIAQTGAPPMRMSQEKAWAAASTKAVWLGFAAERHSHWPQASRPYVSLQIVWPLGSCALITLPSSDNAKFKLDPKPDIPNLAQASSDHAGLRPSSRSCVVLTHSEETAGMQCAHLAAARGLGCKGAGRACSFDRTKS